MSIKISNKNTIQVKGCVSRRLCSSLHLSFSRPLAFLFVPLFCALFYARCSTKIEPCDGDTTADPEFDCLPYAPEFSEPESDGAVDYKIPIKGVSGLDKYEYQEACFATYMEAEAVNWEGRAIETAPVSMGYITVSPDSVTEPLCFYRARACNQYGCGRWTEPVKIVSGLTVPNNLRVDGITPDADGVYTLNTLTYSIAWDAVGPDIILNRYEYREGDAPGQSAGSGLSASVTKTSYGVRYSYQARSCGSIVGNNLGESCSAWGPAAIVKLRLPRPLNLSSDELDSFDKVYTISWDAVDEIPAAGGYHLQERSSSASTWTDVGDGASLITYESRGNAGSVGGISYRYRVRACTISSVDGLAADDIRCSFWVSGMSVNVRSLSKTSALNLVGGSAVSHSSSFTVAWDSITGANVYILSESVDGNTARHEIDAGASSKLFSGKEYGKTYSYALKACVGDGSEVDFTCVDQDGASPAALSVKVKPATPTSLSDDDSQQSTDGEYVLTWGTVDAGTGTYYELQERSKALSAASFPAPDWPKLSDGSEKLLALDSPGSVSHSVSKTGANFEKHYEYRVRACASNDECSDWLSTSTALSLKFEQPALESISAPTSGSYTLNWNSITGADGYVVEEIQYDGSNWPAFTSSSVPNANTNSSEVSGKDGGDKFKYRVKACFGNHCGDYSVESNEVLVPIFPGDPNIGVEDQLLNEQDNEYSIVWSSVEDAARYEFKEWIEGDTEPAYTDLGEAASFRFGANFVKTYAGQAYQKSYHYKVRACVGVKNCTLESAVTVNVKLAVPSFMLANVDSPETDGVYGLSWDSAANADNYILEMRKKRSAETAFPANWTKIEKYGSGAGSYNSTSIDAHIPRQDSDYEYRLSACVRSTAAAFVNSNEQDCERSTVQSVSVVMAAPVFIDEIGYFESAPLGFANYTIDWGGIGDVKISSVEYFEVQEDGAFDFSNAQTHKVEEGERAVNNKKYGPAYYYRVRGCVDYNANDSSDPGECSAWSAVKEVGVTKLPVNLGPAASSSNPAGQYTSSLTEYSLEWGGVPNYTYLRFSDLEECTADCDQESSWTSEYSGADTSVDLSGKTFGSSYSYRIQVCNDGSDGVASNTDDKCSPYTQISVTVGEPL